MGESKSVFLTDEIITAISQEAKRLNRSFSWTLRHYLAKGIQLIPGDKETIREIYLEQNQTS